MGRQCEGYAQFPVFLNRTKEGFARRVHLDEAKSITPRATTTVQKIFQPTHAFSQLAMQISGLQAWETQVVAWFWQSYASSSKFDDSGVESSGGSSVWLYRAVEVAHPIPVLNQALLALSTARYGRVIGNLDITKYGQRVYGIALRLLQEALYDEVSMLNDETLASVRALILYEVSKLWHTAIPLAHRCIRSSKHCRTILRPGIVTSKA